MEKNRAFLIGIVVIAMLAAISFMAAQLLLPFSAPKTYKPWIPRGAQVISGNDFGSRPLKSTEITMAEMKAAVTATGTLPLVVIQEDKGLFSKGKGEIKYFLPTGNWWEYQWSAESVTAKKTWLNKAFGWVITFDVPTLTFKLEPRRDWEGIALATILLILGICLLFIRD